MVADPYCLTTCSLQETREPLAEKMSAELQGAARSRPVTRRILGIGDIFDQYKYVGEDQHSWRPYEEGRWQPQSY